MPVLESIVAGVLNKYLGKYVENLESKNLDVGILSGNLELNDLDIKPEALYELNLPIEVKAGHIGRIFIDVSWTSLFSQPLVVDIEDVFVLVGPIADRPYDAEREQRLKSAIKQKALEELEKPKRKKTKSQVEEEESLSFSERLTASIINNVQIRVSNVHFRYEDSTTHPGKPFAFGFTLQRLAAEKTTPKSTDERWEPLQIDSEATILRKLADMTAMCVYWNPHIHQLVGRFTSGNSWKDLMKDAITSLQVNGEEFDLVVHPITTMARLYYDKTSAPDYVSPMFVIDILTDTIAMGLSQQQYLCVLDLAESMKLMEVNERYRKYRPNVPLRGNAKEWWHYAINSILEEHIRPWSRDRLMSHHQLYHRYLQKFKEKLIKADNKQDQSAVDRELAALEQRLDVTSIVIAREKAKLQFAKEAPERERKRREKKEKEKSWFWSLLGYDSESSSSEEEESEGEEDLWSQLTEEERDKISSGIGFSKKSIEELAHMPMEYVQNKISFQLSTCTVTLKNHNNKILQTSFQNVQVGFETRPAAGAIHLMLSTDSLVVQGSSPDREPVTVITSEKVRNDTVCQVFSLDFETNPLMVRADSALAITTEPIDITYHEHSVSELVSYLTVPNINLEGLKSAAYTQWQELTKAGRAGIIHAIENHKTIQVDIDVKSPNLIIPEFGSMDRKGHRLVVDLGSLRVNSDLQKGYTALEDATPTEIEARLYDKMIVRLDDIQVLLVDAGDDWNEALLLKESSFHLLPSMGVQLNLFNSVKPDYKVLPQQKVEAVLPSLKFLMSDQKLQTILQFAKNLPLPDFKPAEEEIRPGPKRGIVFLMDKAHIKRDTTFGTLKKLKRAASRRKPPGLSRKASKRGIDMVDSGTAQPPPPPPPPAAAEEPADLPNTDELFYSASDHSDDLQQWAAGCPVPCFDDNDSNTNRTSLLLRFVIREVVLIIDKLDKPTVATPSTDPLDDMPLGAESPDNASLSQEAEYLMLRIDSVCTDVAVSTYGTAVQLGLKSINVIDKFHTGPDGAYLHLLSSAAKSELISILYRKVDRKCPDFIGYYNAMEQAVTVRFTALNMVFHRTAVLYLKNFLQELQHSLQKSSLGRAVSIRSQRPAVSVSVGSSASSLPSAASTESTPSKKASPAPSAPILRGIVKFYLQARMDYLRVSLVDVYENMADVYVRDLDFSISDRASKTNIRARLRDFSVEDPLCNSLYSKLLCLQDQTAFDLKLTMFKKLPLMPSRTKSLSSPSSPEGSVETNDSIIHHVMPLNYDVRLKIGRVQAIWLTQTVKNFMAFFQPFINQEVVETARVTTQQAVQQQVEDLTRQGVRIGLNLNIRAPVIFVPQGPQSTHTLVANLGDLLISNTLEEAEGTTGGKSLVDHISVQLYSVQVSRGIVNVSDQVLQSHRLLVEPVSLHLEVKRSLPPYAKDRVPLDISGTLANIQINIGEQDMMTVLAVFNDNLFSTPDLDRHTHAEIHTPPPSPAYSGVDAPEGAIFDDPDPPLNVKEINISFEMEGVEIRLFTNEPRLLKNGQGLSKREPRYGLSRFQLQEVATIVSVYKDSTLELSSSIQTIMLDDIRVNSPLAIRKLLLKSERHYHVPKTAAEKSSQSKIAGLSEDKAPPMVEFTYTQNAKKDQQVTFTIEGVRINIFVHYLLAIYNFLSSTRRRTRLESPMSSTGSNTSRQNLRTIIVPGQGSVIEGPHHETSTRGKVRITGEVRRPEVVLFDDPTSQDSQVLVLKMEGRMAYHAVGTEESALANISDMQMFSCVYSQALKTAYQVLDPCAISFTRTVSLEGETMGIDVTDVKLHVSPRVVFVVSGVVEALTSVTQKQSNNRGLIEDYEQEDMWTPKPIFSHGFHKRRGSMKNMVDFAPIPDPNASTQHLKVQMPRVQLLLEYEEGSEHVAMLCARSGVHVKIADWSQSMRTEAEISLEVLVLNERLSTWEPLLEPVMEKENVYRPWELLLKMVKAESRPIVCTSQLDSNPCDPRDTIDGGVSIIRDTAYVSDSGTEEDSEGGDTELEWDGHYSSSYLSSDVGSPMDPDKKLFQNEPTSEDEVAADTDGLFDRVKDFFGDFFSESDSEDDEGEGHHHEGDEEATQQLLEGGRTDSGIASLARPASASLTSSESKDDTDSDLNLLEAESLATYMVINSRDRLELTATPCTLGTLKDLMETFTTRPKPQMNVILEEAAPLLVVNTTGMKAKLTVLADQVRSTATEHVSLIPVGKAVIPGIDCTDSSVSSSRITSKSECLTLDSLSGVVKVSRYSDVPEIVSPLNASAQIAKKPSDDTDSRSDQPPTEDDMVLEVEGFRPLDKFLSARVGQTLYFLTPSKKSKDLTQYAVVREVNVSHGRKSIKIRSPLQVTNNCSVPLQLFYKKLDLQSLQGATIPGEEIDEHTLLATLEPNQTFDIPVVVAYNAGLYACPMDQQEFGVSEKPILWQELEEPKEGVYCCPSRKRGEMPFHFKVLRKEHKIQGLSNSAKVPSYVLNIYPPITIHNFLPYDVVYSVKQENGLKFLLRGDKMDVHSTDLSEKQNLKLQIKNYLSANWEGELRVSREMKAFESINMGTRDHLGDQKKYLTLWAHSSTGKGSWDIFLYSPYWVVNKSELPVEVRASRSRKVFNNHSHSDPILFSFASSKRKKAKLRVFDSVWSSSFSLDTVGSSGVVMCKDEDHDRTYQFWLDIKLSKLSLTKIVTITPYFLVRNKTDMVLSYMEEGVRAGIWVNIKPNEVLSFWPGGKSMKLTVRKAETPDQLSSRHFSVDTTGTTVLRMEKGTALTVEVEGGVRSPTTVTFMPYTTGHAPVRLDNLCDDINLRFNQKNVGGRMLVQPRKNMLYTWDDPTAERQLMWNLYNRNKKSYDCVIDRDGWGKMTISLESIKRSMLPGDGLYVEGDDASIYSTDDEDEPDAFMDHPLMNKKEKTTMYWVSYMDGLQRVLMFTQNPRVARQASQANISEPANIEIFMSLEGAGLSLINAAYEEVTYCSIYCCPARWEVETKPEKWKALNMELSAILEDRWRSGDDNVSMENAVEADLARREIKKPVCGTLRRTYTPSLWVHYRQSDHHMGLHVKVQKLQIDNQLFDAYFPTVLHVSPLPRDVLKRSGPKPFIELSMLRRQVPENDVDTIKYFKVLIQEASVKIDNGFLLSVLDVISGLQEEQEEVLSLQSDLAMVQRSLKEMASSISGHGIPIYFEYFHLSPLKFIVSLSLSGEPHVLGDQTHTFKHDLARFFVESIGSTLTEVTEVELKLAYFERTNTLMTTDQLLEEAKGHYISQGVKQAYVFILGLEVLGNPYGLFRDVKEGISDFFYEPYLGAIQGPGEFAEGLARGVQSLLGHTVGGVADTFAGLSGTLGRALAVLSFDEDYQKRRQMYMQRHPDSFPKTLLHAGQGFVMGIVMGLSGIVVSPVRGAQDEGIKGFFKGIGKGLLGIIAKPTGGICDSVTLILEGIGRAAEMGEEIAVRVRIPRFIDPKVGVSAYSPYLSVGNCMLHSIRRREFYETDVYFIHAVVSDDSTPDVALITDRRVMLIEKCRWWGGWDLKHADLFANIKGTPILDGGKIVYHIKDDGKMVPREINCNDEDLSQWLFDQLSIAMYLPQQESTPGAFVTAEVLHSHSS